MKKQIIMTIPEFMNIKRENVSRILSCRKYLESCVAVFSLMLAYGVQVPIKAPAEQTNIELAKQTFDVLYVITVVGAECIYDLVINIASTL
jgi:hypothetical protein